VTFVTGNGTLSRDAEHDGLHRDLHHLVRNRDDEAQTRTADLGQDPTEPEHHAALVLLHLTDGGPDKPDDEHNEDDEDDPPGDHDGSPS